MAEGLVKEGAATTAGRYPSPPVTHPANSNDRDVLREECRAMTTRAGAFFSNLDDGTMLRWLFRAILVGSAVVLALDLNEIRRSEADAAPYGDDVFEAPILPPSLSDGAPEAPPFDIRSQPETLKQPARFDLLPGGVLKIEGAFDVGAASRFAAEIEERGEYVTMIELNSPGGSVDDALAISTLIREKGYDTRITEGALCASSCPIVMAGGVGRMAQEGAVVGVHQVYGVGGDVASAARAMSQAQVTTARVSRHLAEMGIANGLWLHALETPPDRLYYLSQDEMREFTLVTADGE
jgi:hypothetical protein